MHQLLQSHSVLNKHTRLDN